MSAVDNPLAQGDGLFAARADPQQSLQALQFYQQAIAAQPNNTEPLWKASRAAWWAGTLLDKRSERLKLFQKGKDFAQTGIRLNPNSVEAQFWLGANYSSYGHVKGALSSLFALPAIRRAMKEVVRLDGRYMGGGAYRVLGIIDYKLPGWAGGNDGRAKELLLKALECDPQNPVTLFYLADYYAHRGEPEVARHWLKKFQDLAPSPDFQLEKQLILKEQRVTIKKLEEG